MQSFGQFLIEKGVVTVAQFLDAVEQQQRDSEPLLGKIRSLNQVSEEVLIQAVFYQIDHDCELPKALKAFGQWSESLTTALRQNYGVRSIWQILLEKDQVSREQLLEAVDEYSYEKNKAATTSTNENQHVLQENDRSKSSASLHSVMNRSGDVSLVLPFEWKFPPISRVIFNHYKVLFSESELSTLREHQDRLSQILDQGKSDDLRVVQQALLAKVSNFKNAAQFLGAEISFRLMEVCQQALRDAITQTDSGVDFMKVILADLPDVIRIVQSIQSIIDQHGNERPAWDDYQVRTEWMRLYERFVDAKLAKQENSHALASG